MGVINLALVQVVCQVEMNRVPASVLKVNQRELGVVLKGREDIIFLRVTVGQHNIISINKATEILLVPLEETVAINSINSLHQVGVRRGTVFHDL